MKNMPIFHVLMYIFHFISDFFKKRHNITLYIPPMTFMRIRLNLIVKDLDCRFNVNSSTESQVFNHVIHVCFLRLIPSLVSWPEREHNRNNLPLVLKNGFPHCVVIIGCSEINFERSSDMGARNKTYSHYKSHNTIIYLIAISPLGYHI